MKLLGGARSHLLPPCWLRAWFESYRGNWGMEEVWRPKKKSEKKSICSKLNQHNLSLNIQLNETSATKSLLYTITRRLSFFTRPSNVLEALSSSSKKKKKSKIHERNGRKCYLKDLYINVFIFINFQHMFPARIFIIPDGKFYICLH